MRTNHVLTLAAVLFAGIALGGTNTAQAARGDSGRNESNSRHSQNDRYNRNDRGHNNNSSRHDRRDDRYSNKNRSSGHGNKTVIIKEKRDRWDVGEALLYQFGKAVINDVFDTPVRRTKTVIINNRPSGYYNIVWIEPVYEYRRTECGQRVKVIVREGFYKKIWIPATPRCETGYH